VKEAVELFANRLDYGSRAMAGVQAANAAGEVDHSVAIDIFNDSALGALDEDGGHVQSALRNRRVAALHQLLRAWTGDRGAEVVCWPFQYHPMGDSLRLMWTCFVSRYSSMPCGPSSRPKPDCL